MRFIPFLLAVVAYGIVGAALHELAHYVSARALGRDAAVSWKDLTVYTTLPDDGPTWRDKAVGFAPLLTGAVAGVSAVLAGVTLTVPAVVGWAMYTLYGARSDYEMTVVYPQRDAS